MAGTEFGTLTVIVGISVSQETKIDVDDLEERITGALCKHWEVNYVEREPGYLDEDYDPDYEDTVEIFASVKCDVKKWVNEFGQIEVERNIDSDEIGPVLEKAGIKHDYVSIIDSNISGCDYLLCA